jgi:hypothetical protein
VIDAEASVPQFDSEPNAAEILSRFHAAARFLATTPAVNLLEAVFSRRSLLQQALDLVQCIDHVGFIAPAEAFGHLGAAAASAGFDSNQRTFPSTILARELGQAAGRALVPTTIFKARGGPVGVGCPGVEVAIPREVEPDVLHAWIHEGRGEHVAFRLGSRSYFGPICRLVEEEGFRVPGFMSGAALTNPFEQVTSAYFDRGRGPSLRLEFCHYG